MTQKAAAPTTTSSPRAKDTSALGTLGLDLLDTTWRIAVPVILLAVGGILLDRTLNTAPWITLLGVVIGFGIAALLVKKQLAAVEAREAQKENKS